nr:hypothetical protein [Chromobacterium sp. Beijing]
MIELLRFRRVDALSLLVLLGIGLSLLAMLLGGDARLLLLRVPDHRFDRLRLSAVPGAASAAGVLSGAGDLGAGIGAGAGTVRTTMARGWLQARHPANDAVVGLGLEPGGGRRAYLAWTWPVERFLLVAPFISYGVMGGLCLMTLLYRRKMRREAAVAMAAL